MFQGDVESDQPFHTFFMESLEQSIEDGVERTLAYFTMLPSSPIKDVCSSIFDMHDSFSLPVRPIAISKLTHYEFDVLH
jgi:hypothetical protein